MLSGSRLRLLVLPACVSGGLLSIHAESKPNKPKYHIPSFSHSLYFVSKHQSRREMQSLIMLDDAARKSTVVATSKSGQSEGVFLSDLSDSMFDDLIANVAAIALRSEGPVSLIEHHGSSRALDTSFYAFLQFSNPSDFVRQVDPWFEPSVQAALLRRERRSVRLGLHMRSGCAAALDVLAESLMSKFKTFPEDLPSVKNQLKSTVVYHETCATLAFELSTSSGSASYKDAASSLWSEMDLFAKDAGLVNYHKILQFSADGKVCGVLQLWPPDMAALMLRTRSLQETVKWVGAYCADSTCEKPHCLVFT
eukprot:ANDGO_08065.mRNA.1 hypothetical protein